MADGTSGAWKTGPGSRYYTWIGRSFGLVWLFFLIYPILGVLNERPDNVRVALGFAGIALFGAVYVWIVLRVSFAGPAGSDTNYRTNLALLAGLAVLAALLIGFYGIEFLGLLIYISTASANILPARSAVRAILGATVLGAALSWFLGAGWLVTGQFVILIGGVGFSLVGFLRMADTVDELRAAREEIARLAVSEERLRFARDLHDLLGHSLSMITLKSELAGRLLPAVPEKAASEIRDIEGVARDALREVREAVAGYRQPRLEAELAGAREMLGAAGIECRCDVAADSGTAALHPSVESVLAWAVREGVTNVIRHSRANTCEVRVSRNAAEANVEVTDDGRGVNWESLAGSGLSGLAERVEARGGSLEAGPQDSGGFRLKVTLPVAGGPVGMVAGGGERRSG